MTRRAPGRWPSVTTLKWRRTAGTPDAERSEGRLSRQLPSFHGLWSFSRTNRGEGALLYLSQKRGHELVDASLGYDLPAFNHVRPRYLEDRRAAGWHRLWLSAAWRRTDLDRRSAGAHRSRRANLQPSDQYGDGAKFTQGGEKLDDAIKWAENELEATLRV